MRSTKENTAGSICSAEGSSGTTQRREILRGLNGDILQILSANFSRLHTTVPVDFIPSGLLNSCEMVETKTFFERPISCASSRQISASTTSQKAAR